MSLNLDKSTWTRVKLGDVAAASKEKVDPKDGSVGRYVAGEHMDSDDLKIHRWGNIGDIELGPAFHRRLRPGQVLYGSRRTYLRKVAVADFDGVCANTTFVVATKNPEVLHQEFLPFIMTAEPFHAFAIAESKGSVNPYVNWTDIERYEFDLPPLEDQKRLADLFWTVEYHSRSLKELRRVLAENRFEWLNTKVNGFVDSNTVPFKEIWSRSPESGWSAPPVDYDTGQYVLSLAAIGPEGYRGGQLKNILPSDKSVKLKQGDMIISRANTAETVGRIAIYPEDRADVSFPDTMMRLHIVEEIDSDFVAAVLSSSKGKEYMRSIAAGSATSMVKINRQSLGRFPFPNVSKAEQMSTVLGLKSFDDAISSVELEFAKVAKTRLYLLAQIFGVLQ